MSRIAGRLSRPLTDPRPLMDLQDQPEVLEQDREEDQPRGGRGEEPELEPDRGVLPAHTGKGKNVAEMTFRARQQRNRSKSFATIHSLCLSIDQAVRAK